MERGLDVLIEPIVTVVIVAHNRKQDLREAIVSVRNQTYGKIEIVVVDNASEDGSAEMVEREFPEAVLAREPCNTGPYGGRNKGIDRANGEILYFLDDDKTLAPDALREVVGVMSEDQRIGVVASKVIDVRTGLLEWTVPPRAGQSADQGFFLGEVVDEGALAVRRCVFEDAGGWPAHYFRQSVGRELGLRVLSAGYDIWYCPGSVVYHKNSPLGDLSRDQIEKEKHFYRVRNELWIAWTYLPLSRAILETGIKVLYHPLSSVPRGAFAHSVRGVASALRTIPRIVRFERSPLRPEILAKRDSLLYVGAVTSRDDLKRITQPSSARMVVRRAQFLFTLTMGRAWRLKV